MLDIVLMWSTHALYVIKGNIKELLPNHMPFKDFLDCSTMLQQETLHCCKTISCVIAPEQATLRVFVHSCRLDRGIQDTVAETCSSCAALGFCLNRALPVCPLKEWHWMLNRSHACSPLYTYFIPIRQEDQKLFSFSFPPPYQSTAILS